MPAAPVPGILRRLLLLAWLLPAAAPQAAPIDILVPQIGLRADDIAVVINENDPLSVEIGDYYRRRRGIPVSQVISVRFDPDATVMAPLDFLRIKREVDRATPDHVQAYALTWAQPYRVGCMSITMAFADGYSEDYCAEGCLPTRYSRYYGSGSLAPFTDHGIRPTMALAAADFETARRLIDRGIAADGSWPRGRGVLARTSDESRTVRQGRWPLARAIAEPVLPMEIVDADAITERRDLLFYFTGLKRVRGIEANRYLPGAVADHLTSLGGLLTDSSQMSALRWLEAGTTGSYGTVVEPCNILDKFPDVPALLPPYLSGESLVEAYWKSLRMPGQGIFIGEPLARPWGGLRYRRAADDSVALEGYALGGRRWEVLGADYPVGPYRRVTPPTVLTLGRASLSLPSDLPPYVWLKPVGAPPLRWSRLSP